MDRMINVQPSMQEPYVVTDTCVKKVDQNTVQHVPCRTLPRDKEFGFYLRLCPCVPH